LERLHEDVKHSNRIARLFSSEAPVPRLIGVIEVEINGDNLVGKRCLDANVEVGIENV